MYLGDLLEKKNMAPDLHLELRQKAVERMTKAKKADATAPGETIRGEGG